MDSQKNDEKNPPTNNQTRQSIYVLFAHQMFEAAYDSGLKTRKTKLGIHCRIR